MKYIALHFSCDTNLSRIAGSFSGVKYFEIGENSITPELVDDIVNCASLFMRQRNADVRFSYETRCERPGASTEVDFGRIYGSYPNVTIVYWPYGLREYQCEESHQPKRAIRSMMRFIQNELKKMEETENG